MARVDSKESRMEKRMMEGKTRNRDEAGFLAPFPSLPFPSLPFLSLPFPLFSFSTLRLELKKRAEGSVKLGPIGTRWCTIVT